MKKILFALFIVMMLTLVWACSNDDSDNASDAALLQKNEWVMVSYVTDQEEVKKEENGYYYSLIFRSDGYFSGWAYGNQIGGKYKCSSSMIEFSEIFITQVYMIGADEDEFFLKYIRDVYTYKLTDTELRLYFAEGQYFKFRKTEVTHGRDAW